MTVFPVIVRELRASARQPFTYSLRLLGVGALLLVSAVYWMFAESDPGFGRELFAALHRTLHGAIWVMVPMLTADCISRERREGTLGLLFMTPLKGTDIVVAKSLAHGLRAITLWLAALPVLTLPFLVGGVSSAEAALSVVINANAMCWALAAGLLASAWSKAWLRSLLGALMLAFAFFLALTTGVGWLLLQTLGVRPRAYTGPDWDAMLWLGLSLVGNIREFWSYATGSTGSFYQVSWMLGGRMLQVGAANQLIWVLAQISLCSLLVLVCAAMAAGASIRRSWREEPPSGRQVWLQQTFCTPVLWLSFFRRWMRRKLERNPIGWLEQRTWSGRLVTWGWVAVLMTIYIAILTSRHFYDGSDGLHEFLALLLLGSMAASAAGSFRRERETGVLELLLVSPLQEKQIILGRLKGLWSQFAPGAAFLMLVWAYCATFQPKSGGIGPVGFFLSTLLTLPVFGLYYSLCCRNFFTALLATLGVGLLLPLVVVRLVAANLPGHSLDVLPRWDSLVSLAGVACQVLLCPIWWYLLCRRLSRRSFPWERSQTG